MYDLQMLIIPEFGYSLYVKFLYFQKDYTIYSISHSSFHSTQAHARIEFGSFNILKCPKSSSGATLISV